MDSLLKNLSKSSNPAPWFAKILLLHTTVCRYLYAPEAPAVSALDTTAQCRDRGAHSARIPDQGCQVKVAKRIFMVTFISVIRILLLISISIIDIFLLFICIAYVFLSEWLKSYFCPNSPLYLLRIPCLVRLQCTLRLRRHPCSLCPLWLLWPLLPAGRANRYATLHFSYFTLVVLYSVLYCGVVWPVVWFGVKG